MGEPIDAIVIKGTEYKLCKYKQMRHVSVIGNYEEEGFGYVSPDHKTIIKAIGCIGLGSTGPVVDMRQLLIS